MINDFVAIQILIDGHDIRCCASRCDEQQRCSYLIEKEYGMACCKLFPGKDLEMKSRCESDIGEQLKYIRNKECMNFNYDFNRMMITGRKE